MLVFLTAAYFFFMATEAVFVDTSSRISEIVEVHSGVLVDLLVVLAVMFDAVAPSSPWSSETNIFLLTLSIISTSTLSCSSYLLEYLF